MPRPAPKRRGRPKGRKKVPFPLRVYPEQKRALDILSEILEGAPPVNGLIQAAIEQYITRKLGDQRIRAEFDAKLAPRLRVMS